MKRAKHGAVTDGGVCYACSRSCKLLAVSGRLKKLGFCRSFRKCPLLCPKPCHPVCVNVRISPVQRNAHWRWTDLRLSWLFMEALRSKALLQLGPPKGE